MSSIIRATTTSGLQIVPDNSGSLILQTNGTTTAVTIDTSQNVGIGVTPNAWTTSNNTKALQISTLTSVYQAFTGSNFASNTYYNGTNDVYITTAAAGKFAFDAGNNIFTWSSAASGTAGTTIAFTERMRIDSNGYLLVNQTTTSAGADGRLSVSATSEPAAAFKNTSGASQYTVIAITLLQRATINLYYLVQKEHLLQEVVLLITVVLAWLLTTHHQIIV
jgi:hypothetical protein